MLFNYGSDLVLSGSVAIRYVLPVYWMTSYLLFHNWPYGAVIASKVWLNVTHQHILRLSYDIAVTGGSLLLQELAQW